MVEITIKENEREVCLSEKSGALQVAFGSVPTLFGTDIFFHSLEL